MEWLPSFLGLAMITMLMTNISGESFGRPSAAINPFLSRTLSRQDLLDWPELYNAIRKRNFMTGNGRLGPNRNRYMNWNDLYQKRFYGGNSYDGFEAYFPHTKTMQNWKNEFGQRKRDV
ncbi:hypothetical protein FSP39_010755 [Pinctada imbricata]|uniref:Uncharacterized protein n=1 Tax=Pinctada imbricata TaxID=66713 RepID=A0AA89C6N3_PINIB|nr:hypothetical protein FSP39_010755 [Pinctada imbricata]